MSKRTFIEFKEYTPLSLLKQIGPKQTIYGKNKNDPDAANFY